MITPYGNILLRPLVDRYLAQVTAPNTRRAKDLDLSHFLTFLAEGANTDQVQLGQWTSDATARFLEERMQHDSPNTCARRLATLKHFGGVIEEQYAEQGFRNPAKRINTPPVPQMKAGMLSPETVARLVGLLDGDASGDFVQCRQKLIVGLLLLAGLKVDEVIRLRLSDWDESGGRLVNVGLSDGSSARSVPVNALLREVLEQYLRARAVLVLDLREREANHADARLLVSSYGADADEPDTFAVSPKTIWRTVSELGWTASRSPAARTESLSPTALRDTFIFELLSVSGNPVLVARVAGVTPSHVVNHYLDFSEDEVAPAVEGVAMSWKARESGSGKQPVG